MARRSDHSRDELYRLILDGARRIAAAEGVRGLTARRVAAEIGYAPGTIYNLFDNLDDLILHLRGETLDRFYDFLAAKPAAADPLDALLDIVADYVAFVGEHAGVWSLMFEHRLPEGVPVPPWYHDKTMRLLRYVAGFVGACRPSADADDNLYHAQLLWAALHGICSIQFAGKLVRPESAEAMARSLVVNYIAGLRHDGGGGNEAG